MSSPLIVAGRVGAREVAISSTRSRDGNDIVRTVTGLAEDVFALEASTYFDGASSVNVTQQVGSCLATMTARYAFTSISDEGGEPGQNIVEELSSQYSNVPIPIKQHSYFSNLNIDGIITIDNAIDSNSDFPAGGDGLNGDTKWEEYYLLRQMGVNEFEAKLPSVRYTIRCSPIYSGILETSKVGKVFTKEQMLARVSAPKFFDVTEPSGVFNANAYGYFYPGWRMDATVSLDNDGRGILEEVYTWGQFAKQLYSFEFSTP